MNWCDIINSTPGPKTRQEYFSLYFKGMGMGIADLIPGVSGGTIAFITGIYEQFLVALQSLGRENLRKLFALKFKLACQEIHIRFLATLGLGIATSVILFARLMHYLLVNHATYTWSFFFGLIIASVPSLLKTVQNPWGWRNIAFLFIGAVGGYVITGLIPVETPDSLLFIAFSGFVAIAALILPGISGSFLLLILGKYEIITAALKSPFTLDHLMVLFALFLGASFSLVSVSQVLGKLYKKYPHRMTALLTGLLIGSLRKVWPWKEVVNSIVIRGKEKVLETHNFIPEMTPQVALATVVMAFGVIVIMVMDHYREKVPS